MKFYHKNGCPLCKIASMKLQSYNIECEDILVNPDDNNDMNFAHLMGLGVKQMPVLEFNDGTYVQGAAAIKWINAEGNK